MTSKSKISVKAPTLRWRVICAVGICNLGLLAVFPNCSTAPMPELSPGPGKVMGSILGGVIFSPGLIKTGISNVMDKKEDAKTRKTILQRKSYPEREWNQSGLWEKIKSSPATYVPKGYRSVAKYDYDQGTWFVDPEDSKRLFAPRSSWGNHDSRFWMEEAKKIADHLWLPPGTTSANLNKKQQ